MIFGSSKVKKEKFTGWQVLVGCMLCMFFVQGTLQCWAIYMPLISEDTGWTIARISLNTVGSCTTAFIASVLIAPMLKKISVRFMLILGILSIFISLTVYSVSGSVYGLCLGGLFSGLAIAWGSSAPCSILITNWFVKNRSQYVALTVAASMFGSVVFTPIAAAMCERFGWRLAYFLQGVFCAVAASTAVLLLIKDSPEKLGQRPYGEAEAAIVNAQSLGGVTVSEAKRSLSYPLLAVGIFLLGMSTNIENYMPAYWQFCGLSAMQSATVMSGYSFMAAIVSIVMSQINDRLGGKNYVLITTTLFVLSVLLMSYTKAVTGVLPLLACCLPFAVGSKKSSTVTPSLVVAEAFGRRYYPTIISLFAGVLQLGIAVSPLVLAPLLDYGYQTAFTVMVVVNILACVLMVTALIRKPYKVNTTKGKTI